MAPSAPKPLRKPTVLVTDAREAPWRNTPPSRPPPKTKLISVDNILQYASEIPSGQRRGPPDRKPLQPTRTPSGKHPLDPKLTGRLGPQHMPARSSKFSEKLVLLPEAEEVEGKHGFPEVAEEDNEDEGPPKDDEVERRRHPGPADKSYAERLPKARRTEKLARVTAYCTAQAYKLAPTAQFVKSQHGTRTKLYDDCLYCVYQLPLLAGHEGYRVRSSPVLKSPGGKSVLDLEIERNELAVHNEGYFADSDQYSVTGSPNPSPGPGSIGGGNGRMREGDSSQLQHEDERDREQGIEMEQDQGANGGQLRRSSSPPRVPPNALSTAEMFVFSYGVAVFWNFSERQEKDILADLTFSESETGLSLVTRPQREEDFETEEFHFEYNPDIPRPRVYNDMITLRTGDHMVKLSMSHAIAQSTKLCFFEERMARTMLEAQYVPRRLALTGHLGMKREEVVRMLGQLYMSRVDVNLSSNMLDTPNFFWDSEPTLHPLYTAVREYLEISPRIKVLNERCRVFLDLAEILSDSIADKKMTRITLIIIILIVVSILVTCAEVFLRFGILTKGGKVGPGAESEGATASPREL